MIGKRIGGRYEILRLIGDGGMSKVYLAHDMILDRDVAIKVLDYDFANEEELKRRFKREALSATSLTHSNIVNVFDVGEDGEIHYLVMEYVEGQTVKKFIQTNGPLPAEQAVTIMKQLVSAISNAHHNGIIHRDVKPQNILMDASGEVKITDFGIAMALSATAHTKTNSVIGTVHYLSPEQARGGMATKRSDIYSLGIVFYELLTAQLPFSAETAVAIALKHLQEETPSVRAQFPDLPQSVENVILKATAKDASYRYQTADEMYEDLNTVLLPERWDEPKFEIPFDDDRTKAIPIVKPPSSKFENMEETKKIPPVSEEKAKAPAEKRKKRKGPIIFGVLAGVILLALLAFLIVNYIGPKQIEVPDVSGLTVKEAEELLIEEGLTVEGIEEETSDEIEEGKVIRTSPEAKTQRDRGTPVTIYVSEGKETAELADYVGRDYDQIAELLGRSDFQLKEPTYVYDEKPKGTILKQEPEGGQEYVPSETEVVFTVSQGVETKKLEQLIGLHKDELEKYAGDSGFDITVIREEYDDSVEEGHVISQNPRAGTALAKGGKVEVILSKGKEKKPVKYIVQTVTIEYEEQSDEWYEEGQERTPQHIQIYVQDRNHQMADPIEDFTIVETTEKRITIELEEGQIGAYRIMRDSKQIADEKFTYDDAD